MKRDYWDGDDDDQLELSIKYYTILRYLNGNGIIVKLNPLVKSKKNMYKIYNYLLWKFKKV